MFGKVIHCGGQSQNGGQEPDLIVDLSSGHRGYICMARAIDKYPGFKGECHVFLCVELKISSKLVLGVFPQNF